MGKESSDQASSYSWWWGSHNHPNQSQWLHSTLSDLDNKIKMMLNIIEEDGDSFAKRADVYFSRRPELIKMVEELHRSYRSLAEKYDLLRPESTEAASSFRKVQNLQISSKRSSENTELEAPKSHPDKKIESDCVDLSGIEEREEVWDELREKVSKLIEDNLKQQAELVRRNDEKRKAIKVLCARIGKLKDENGALKSCVARNEADNSKQNQSNMSRMKGAIFGKLLQ